MIDRRGEKSIRREHRNGQEKEIRPSYLFVTVKEDVKVYRITYFVERILDH